MLFCGKSGWRKVVGKLGSVFGKRVLENYFFVDSTSCLTGIFNILVFCRSSAGFQVERTPMESQGKLPGHGRQLTENIRESSENCRENQYFLQLSLPYGVPYREPGVPRQLARRSGNIHDDSKRGQQGGALRSRCVVSLLSHSQYPQIYWDLLGFTRIH